MTTDATQGDYVHGYSPREAERLADQANILRDRLHAGVGFAPGSRVLEAGSGTGAQTVALLDACPGIRLTCLDVDAGQLARARERLGPDRAASVTFRHADLLRDGAIEAAAYDHAFVCFLLEHLSRPVDALVALRRAVRPAGTVVVTEGDHGSCRFHPETRESLAVWDALVERQRGLGGDPHIGRRLYGLLTAAGFVDIRVAPVLIYADAGSPELRDGFVRRIIVPMVDGVRADVLATGRIDGATWRRGLADLEATAGGPDGAFCYTFFQATARVL
jgi:SAM-dependent methyltransferase